MRWDDLNMGDKSRIIKLAVDSGITDLRTIHEIYNTYAEGGSIHKFDTGGPVDGDYATLLRNYQDAAERRKAAIKNRDAADNLFYDTQDALPDNVLFSRNYHWKKIPKLVKLGKERDAAKQQVNKANNDYLAAQKDIGAATVEKYRRTTADLLQYDKWSGDEAGVIRYLTNTGVRESVGAQEVADYFNSYASSPGFQRIINNQSEWGQKRHPYRRLYDSDYTKKGFVRDAERLRETLLKNPMRTYGVFDMDAMPGMGFNYTQYATDKWPYAHIIVNAAGNPFLNQQEERYPYWDELTHEMLHDYNFVGTGQGEALDQNTKAEPGHDSRRNEKHSDLEALRFMLYKYGIYDSRGEKDATAEDIKKLREMFPKLRQFEQMDDEQAAWMINHVADINNGVDMSNISKYGGPINKFAGGGPLEENFMGPPEPYIPSDNIKNYIKSTEAFRDKWYTDGNGIPTVGYGFTGKKVKELYPDGMTREQADAYFEDLVSRSARRMIELTPNSDRLTQNQKDALFSYFYNIGEGNYSTGSPKMQQALKDLNLEEVVKNIDAGYNDKKNPGLKKRRDYERSLFEKDIVYPLQPIPPDRSVEMYFNPETTRTRVLVPYNEINTETFNPLMHSLTKRK